MRIDLIVFLSFLLERGYVKSFRVTQDKIFVTIKNNRRVSDACGYF